jgi:hypothetical protein
VNSKKGTQFRIWASRILKEYLVKGYALDKRRLEDQTRQLEELKQTVQLLNHVVDSKPLNTDEATSPRPIFHITYATAMDATKGLKEKFAGSALFGTPSSTSRTAPGNSPTTLSSLSP